MRGRCVKQNGSHSSKALEKLGERGKREKCKQKQTDESNDRNRPTFGYGYAALCLCTSTVRVVTLTTELNKVCHGGCRLATASGYLQAWPYTTVYPTPSYESCHLALTRSSDRRLSFRRFGKMPRRNRAAEVAEGVGTRGKPESASASGIQRDDLESRRLVVSLVSRIMWFRPKYACVDVPC